MISTWQGKAIDSLSLLDLQKAVGVVRDTVEKYNEKRETMVAMSNNMKGSYVGSIAKKCIELIIRNRPRTTLKSVPSRVMDSLSGTYVADGNLSPQLLRVSNANGKLAVSSSDGAYIELIAKGATKYQSPDGITYTFELDAENMPKSIRVENLPFPFIAKYNDGPFDVPGPDKKEWKKYVGIYVFEDDARPAYLALSVINGHLYLIFGDSLRLHERGNCTFFTADGEVVSLDDGVLVYKGITAKKVEFQPQVFLEEIAGCEHKYDHYRPAVSSLVDILYSCKGLGKTLDFINDLFKIDFPFKGFYSKLGRKLFALDNHIDAIRCFEALLEVDPNNEGAKKFLERIAQQTR